MEVDQPAIKTWSTSCSDALSHFCQFSQSTSRQ